MWERGQPRRPQIAAEAAPTLVASTGGTVLLLHGLLMRRLALLPLALRLRSRGYAPSLFPYLTLWHYPDLAIEALASRIESLRARGPVHVVGHSLGGVIAIETYNRYPQLPPGRIVCLGSPIAGSAAARGLQARGLGLMSGRSGPLLRKGLSGLPAGREVGMVAGTRALGLGRWFGRIEGTSDGTVALAETSLPGLAARICVPISHTGLIYSAVIADRIDQFLRRGRFDGPSEVDPGIASSP